MLADEETGFGVALFEEVAELGVVQGVRLWFGLGVVDAGGIVGVPGASSFADGGWFSYTLRAFCLWIEKKICF